MKEFKFFQNETKGHRVNVNPYTLSGSTFNSLSELGGISELTRLRETEIQRIRDEEVKYYWDRRLLPSLESNIVLKPTWWTRIKMFFQSIKIKFLYDETF
jgi:hypothetical protein